MRAWKYLPSRCVLNTVGLTAICNGSKWIIFASGGFWVVTNGMLARTLSLQGVSEGAWPTSGWFVRSHVKGCQRGRWAPKRWIVRSHVEGNEGCYKWYQSQQGRSAHKSVVCKISCQENKNCYKWYQSQILSLWKPLPILKPWSWRRYVTGQNR